MITTFYLFLALTLATPLPRMALAPRADTLRIAVVGDTGEGSDRVAHGIAALHARTTLDAVVITGDAFYPCGPASTTDRQWDRVRALSQIGVPLFPVLGNHDFCGKSVPAAQVGATVVPHWQFPARQYVIESKLAELLMLDTTPYAGAATTKPPTRCGRVSPGRRRGASPSAIIRSSRPATTATSRAISICA